jgi:hypothetical protein
MGAGPEPHAQTHAEPHAQASAQPRAQPRAEAANESMGTFAFKDGSKAEKGMWMPWATEKRKSAVPTEVFTKARSSDESFKKGR